MQKKKHNKAQDLSDQTRKHRMRESLVESGPASGLRPGAPRLILLIASKDLSPSYEYEAGFREGLMGPSFGLRRSATLHPGVVLPEVEARELLHLP